jgi:hypothetical protein
MRRRVKYRLAIPYALLICVVCSGCQVERESRIVRVLDRETEKPIAGAKVWMQPYAPIHPFWPAGDHGVSDAQGTAVLSFPLGFWFYFDGADAPGYHEVQPPDGWFSREPQGDRAFMTFFMKRG